MMSNESTTVSRKDQSQVHSPCFLLHCYDYSESSLVAEVFSREYGRVTLLAKGAKRPQSRTRSILLHFQPLELQWFGKNTLKTLGKVSWLAAPIVLQQSAWMAAWYCNELLLHTMAAEDPHPVLYDDYERALYLLQSGEPVAYVLRWFEWKLLQAIGFAFDPRVTHQYQPVQAEQWYRVSPTEGIVACSHPEPDNSSNSVLVLGSVLLNIYNCCFIETESDKMIQQVLKIFIDHLLQGRDLKTRQVFQGLHRKGG